ncbi:MAG: SDR family oxidoreductase [Natronomonas sp.]|nr:SDR family oxidoreductase [Natronomonas sp.]
MREQIDFSGDSVIVTGAASGIGQGVAEGFAAEGANVVIADIDEERGPSVAEEIADEHGVDAEFVYTDVSDHDSCGETVSATVDAFGSLDVLVNVAAGGLQNAKDLNQPFIEETPDNWAPHIHVTLKGPINMTHNALPVMKEQGGGSVINFASDSYQGQDPNLTMYATAKAGVVTFTKSLAKEVGEFDVRVNCISPSTTWTPSTQEWLDEYGDKVAENYPLGRLGYPEDHANAAIFLASDASDWVTGQVLSVNGGFI